MPPLFESYAKILHSVFRKTGNSALNIGGHPIKPGVCVPTMIWNLRLSAEIGKLVFKLLRDSVLECIEVTPQMRVDFFALMP
jgi:hypothetical protein